MKSKEKFDKFFQEEISDKIIDIVDNRTKIIEEFLIDNFTKMNSSLGSLKDSFDKIFANIFSRIGTNEEQIQELAKDLVSLELSHQKLIEILQKKDIVSSELPTYIKIH